MVVPNILVWIFIWYVHQSIQTGRWGMIGQVELWFADVWTWQEKLSWSESLLIILLMFSLVVLALCWDMARQEFTFGEKAQTETEPDEAGKL